MEGRRLLLPHDQLMNENDQEAADSQSGGDNPGGGGGGGGGGDGGVSDEEGPQNPRRGYHRHNAEQIQELESFFKEFPHPDDRQRMELGRRLGLGARKIKFWFQNRRTQLKTQRERNQNILLREDNARLTSENDVLKFRLTNPTCSKCKGPVFPDAAIGLSFEEKQLIRENAWLKDELARIQSLAEKVMANPVNISHSLLQLSRPSSNGDAETCCEALETGDRTVSTGLSLGNGTSMSPSVKSLEECPYEKAGYIRAAVSAMNELMKLSEAYDPMWTPLFDGPTELLSHEDYAKMFPTSTCLGMSPGSSVREGTRDAAIVTLRSQAIVEILMDADKWLKAFPCLITNASTTHVISDFAIGSKDASLQLMKAEFQVLSPLVSTCQVRFIRFCKQQREGFWAIVDVSVENNADSRAVTYCRRLPSGCILQDLPNNCTKVTWIEHLEYDTSSIHPLFCLAINSGVLFGAPRWLASLQRHCESRNTKLSGINPLGKQNVLKLAQHMNELFFFGICPALWSKENICVGNISEDVKIKYRRSIGLPGEPPGLVLCVSTSFWMPATWDVLFDFLRNERARSQWDILSLTGEMQEIVRVPKGPGHNDCISLLRVTGMDSSQTRVMVVQESWIDPSGALIVYAPLETWVIMDAVRGMDTDTEGTDLLPSGFSIIPVGPLQGQGEGRKPGGSLVTLGFQVLVNDTPSAKLTPESFDTVSNLVSITINKIKVAMGLTSA
ncbi:hypothetical protein MLD38_025666 [Melastoma candidum]|uniref:Uncharacterized protein n=1 Tax=Melastoma candidum TaxID=119954 RepID=A0ACB9NWJ2_9MYRT|nr:hypothetical protein MLD38_025666 [Melastoma candidum]